MQNWIRRVALGLAVPLVAGMPVLVVVGPASAAPATNTFISLDSPTIVYGQETRATAHVVDDPTEQPVTTGSVVFEARRAFTSDAFWLIGEAPLNGSGNAVSPPLVGPTGAPLEIAVGSDAWQIRATFEPAGGSTLNSSNDSDSLQVDKSGSTMAILPSGNSIVVDLSGRLPGGAQSGSARPTGSVNVIADGQNLGDVDINETTGRATLNHTLAPGQAHTLSATYTGDSRYTGSSATEARQDPKLEARVISLFPRSRAGWYRTPVEIWFRCKATSAPLVGECPADVTLKDSGKNQSVTRTISAIDGGRATVTGLDIDIDREKPHITVDGASCTATDELSGVKRHRCVMRFGADGQYRAIAVDRAGNRAVKKGVLD